MKSKHDGEIRGNQQGNVPSFEKSLQPLDKNDTLLQFGILASIQKGTVSQSVNLSVTRGRKISDKLGMVKEMGDEDLQSEKQTVPQSPCNPSPPQVMPQADEKENRPDRKGLCL